MIEINDSKVTNEFKKVTIAYSSTEYDQVYDEAISLILKTKPQICFETIKTGIDLYKIGSQSGISDYDISLILKNKNVLLNANQKGLNEVDLYDSISASCSVQFELFQIFFDKKQVNIFVLPELKFTKMSLIKDTIVTIKNELSNKAEILNFFDNLNNYIKISDLNSTITTSTNTHKELLNLHPFVVKSISDIVKTTTNNSSLLLTKNDAMTLLNAIELLHGDLFGCNIKYTKNNTIITTPLSFFIESSNVKIDTISALSNIMNHIKDASSVVIKKAIDSLVTNGGNIEPLLSQKYENTTHVDDIFVCKKYENSFKQKEMYGFCVKFCATIDLNQLLTQINLNQSGFFIHSMFGDSQLLYSYHTTNTNKKAHTWEVNFLFSEKSELKNITDFVKNNFQKDIFELLNVEFIYKN